MRKGPSYVLCIPLLVITDNSQVSTNQKENRRNRKIINFNVTYSDLIFLFITGNKRGEWIAENEDKTVEQIKVFG